MARARYLLTLSLLLLLCAAALAACGDTDEDAGAAVPDAKASAQIQKSVSDGVIDQGFGVKEVEAVKVTRVKLNGEKGTAEAELKSKNTLDGQTVAASLVKVGDEWRFYELEGLVHLDKPLLASNFEKELSKPSEKLGKSQARCIARQFEAASQATVEAMFLEESEAAFIKLGKPCRNA
jgi:hypothetical protein